MCSKGNILGCLSNRNKGKVNRCISVFGCQGYLLDSDCYASLAAVLTQIQYDSVSTSDQLLRCMATRLDPILRLGSTLYPLQIFALLCQNCSPVLPRRPSHYLDLQPAQICNMLPIKEILQFSLPPPPPPPPTHFVQPFIEARILFLFPPSQKALTELISQHKSAFGTNNSKLSMKIDEKPT